jgi:hypothetical protein
MREAEKAVVFCFYSFIPATKISGYHLNAQHPTRILLLLLHLAGSLDNQ